MPDIKESAPRIVTDLVSHLFGKESPFDPSPTCAPTGSRVICDPPVMDTDDDWLVFVPCGLQEEALDYLDARGAAHIAKQDQYPDGVCYRYGEVNLVLLWDFACFYRWVATTYWAARLNLRDKAERTSMFAALVDGSVPLESLVLPPAGAA